MNLNATGSSFNARAISSYYNSETIGSGQCRVCGDKSVGYNFGVLTCESCKAFFRRNCQREKQTKCPFLGICEINKLSRRFCQSCRFQKCIKVGMRKEKQARKPSTVKHLSYEGTKQEPTESVIGFKVENFLATADKLDKCKCTCKCGFYEEGTTLTAREKSMQIEIKSKVSYNLLALTPYDQLLLKELLHANTILDAPLFISLDHFQHTTKVDPFNLSLLDVVRISELAMRRIISMAKQLSTFMSLIQEDQIALLKGGLTELLILRGAMVFDSANDIWKHDIYCSSSTSALNLSFLNMDVLKQAAEQRHYLEHKRFLSSFKEEWRQNSTIMLLVNAICLFCPRRPYIINIVQVAAIQNTYSDLLKRFLFTENKERNSIKEPELEYTLLMAKFEELHLLNKGLHLIYGQLNPKDLDPLLQELLSHF